MQSPKVTTATIKETQQSNTSYTRMVGQVLSIEPNSRLMGIYIC